MKLDYSRLELRTRHAFNIARGAQEANTAIWVRLIDDDGDEGWGEANPVAYYGETPGGVESALETLRPAIESVRAFDLQELEAACAADLGGNASAKAAVFAAMYDLMGVKVGLPVHRMLGLDPARAPISSFTIGIDEPDVVRRKVREAGEYPILKIKVGTVRDEELLGVVREEAPEKMLRVDANTAWDPKQAVHRIEALARFDLEFVEQPVASDDIDGLRYVRERVPLPIVADESCVSSADIPGLVGAVDAINIKLAKCGGPPEALRMIHTARSHGLRIMLGCMVESSLGIAAAAHLSPLVDYADLDGAALLANDPFAGLSIAGGRIHLTDEPGLGVTRS